MTEATKATETTIPERIWISPHSAVVCNHHPRPSADDVEYIRADIVDAENTALREQLAEMQAERDSQAGGENRAALDQVLTEARANDPLGVHLAELSLQQSEEPDIYDAVRDGIRDDAATRMRDACVGELRLLLETEVNGHCRGAYNRAITAISSLTLDQVEKKQ